MAGWSKSNDEINHESHNMSCFNLDFTVNDGVIDDCKDSMKSLFDQVIPIYLRDVSVDKCARPLPALLGDGQPVDLFRLFWVVKKKGGFGTVSENGLWGSVAEECMFSAALMSPIKLVYIKYLMELDEWLRQVFMDKRLENGEIQILKKLDLLIVESEELNGLVCSAEGKMRNDGELEFDTTGSSTDINGGKHRSQLSNGCIFNKVHGNIENNFAETESLADLGTYTSELFLSDGCGDLNKVNHTVESSNDNEKDICLKDDKGIMFSAKCIVDNIISSQKIKLCSKVEVDKVKDKVETSRSDDDNEELGVQDDYDILLSARSVVDRVISSMKSEFRSFPEVDNVQENVPNTYDNGEKFPDDYDLLLSARRIADKVNYSQNKGKNLWPGEGINVVHENVGNIKDDYGKVQVQDDANAELSSTSVDNDVVISRKRKWESISLCGMLNWIAQVAKHSDDPAVGVVPGPSKWKDHGTEEYWAQALLARETLLIRRPVYAYLEDSSLQKKLKMHPLMYEDKNALHQSAERVRCSKRLPVSKYQFCPCCNPGPATPRKLISPSKEETHNDWKVPSSPMTAELLNRRALDASHGEEALVRHVSVGPSFQAEISEWTGVATESDSKWLGIQLRALEEENNKTLVEKHHIGKGRKSSCDCSVAGSSSCVRFHIAEKRLELKLALGLLFYRWKFDRMGEDVSLSWTTEEEKRFKTMVLQDSTGQNKFWNNAFSLFPSKTREKLVSYYFNVLVLRRRSYQNRVTPNNIDSDDDETEFGSTGDSAYFEGNHTPESNLPICSLNMQDTDFE